MNKETKKMLSLNATKIRMGIIEGTHSAKAGHCLLYTSDAADE